MAFRPDPALVKLKYGITLTTLRGETQAWNPSDLVAKHFSTQEYNTGLEKPPGERVIQYWLGIAPRERVIQYWLGIATRRSGNTILA